MAAPAVALCVGGYEEITAAVGDELAGGLAPEDRMGSRIDALKPVSSLTRAAEKLGCEGAELNHTQLCGVVLAQTTALEAECTQTLGNLRGKCRSFSAGNEARIAASAAVRTIGDGTT